MKKLYSLLSILLIGAMLLSSCAFGNPTTGESEDQKIQASPFPKDAFNDVQKLSVISAIVQTGDGNAYVSGAAIPSPVSKSTSSTQKDEFSNKHLVTLEHSFGYTCYVSGYIGNSLYIIQDFGSLGWNKKGVGHKDGEVLLEYGENGYFSISSFSENKIIVGNPMDETVDSLWGSTDSYLFGYMIYDEKNREFTPMYSENNLRFYTAGYFINGVAIVSVKENDKILFGVIDAEGNYIVEPTYEMMGDESVNDLVIVGNEVSYPGLEEAPNGISGRFIAYDSTLMTNVQFARGYELKSQCVGIINTTTGEIVLPCIYSYVELVMENTYFVIDNEGAKYLYNVLTKEFTIVEKGVYSYLNSEWALYSLNQIEAYLVDKEMNLYEIEGLALADIITSTNYNAENRINTNNIRAIREDGVNRAYTGTASLVNRGIEAEYNHDKSVYTLTVTESGDVIENVRGYSYPYNNGFLYSIENSLYRYDMTTRESIKIETGYGDFTEDYENWNTRFYLSIDTLDEGLYVLRYNIEQLDEYGSSYHLVIVNDMGEVLFGSNINSVEQLRKNYLGKYDDALYTIAGSTAIEDNYYLTRDDGSHFLIQFVRGKSVAEEDSTANSENYTRIVDTTSTIALLSPFKLNFAKGSQIEVSIGDIYVPSDCYAYDSQAQTIKLFSKVMDCGESLYTKMKDDGYLEILVSSDSESVTLRIEVSPFAFRF